MRQKIQGRYWTFVLKISFCSLLSVTGPCLGYVVAAIKRGDVVEVCLKMGGGYDFVVTLKAE